MRTILLTLFMAITAASAMAGGPTTWRVGASSDAACDFHNLQDAIDEAASECTFASPCVIEVSGPEEQHRGHTYTINGADLAGKASQLFITGGFENCSASEPTGQTVLDADGNGRVLTIIYQADFVDAPSFTTHLSNFVVTGGDNPGGDGGGIRIEGRSGRQFVRMDNMFIFLNSATHGGGLSIRRSSNEEGVSGAWIVMNDSTISNNTATGLGGGVDCTHGGAPGSNNPIIFNDVTITGNSATSGGGVFASNCVNLEFNTAAAAPGNGRISSNSASAAGGGLFLTSGEASLVGIGGPNSALIASNAAENGGGAFITGGSTLNLVDTRVAGNQAAQEGGALYVANSSLLNMRQSDGPLPTAACATPDTPRCSGITENTAVNGHGGGVYVNNAIANVSQTVIRGNRAGGLGSAGHVRAATLMLEGAAISGNFGSSRLFQVEDGNLFVSWSTIAGNEPNEGATLQVFRLKEDDAEPILNVIGSIVWQPGAMMIHDSGSVSSNANCVIGHAGSVNSFESTTFYSETDPLLTDVDGNDLRLQSNSPAIDYCGANDVDFVPAFDDLFGNERGVAFNEPTLPAPNPGDGAFDLGAHERQPFFDQIFNDRFEEQFHPKVVHDYQRDQ